MESTSIHKQAKTVLEGFNNDIENIQFRTNIQFLEQHGLIAGHADIPVYIGICIDRGCVRHRMTMRERVRSSVGVCNRVIEIVGIGSAPAMFKLFSLCEGVIIE